MNNKVNKEKIRKGTSLILEGIGEDIDRDGLKETWFSRVPSIGKEISKGIEIKKNLE